jgi:primosomal protein N' (replication factor Y)
MLFLPSNFTAFPCQTFTSISEDEYHYIKRNASGCSFGKSRIYTALVVETHQNQPTLYDAKEIHQILDETPIVTEVQIAHWQWIASYYMCQAMYIAAQCRALLLESETVISQKTDVCWMKHFLMMSF